MKKIIHAIGTAIKLCILGALVFMGTTFVLEAAFGGTNNDSKVDVVQTVEAEAPTKKTAVEKEPDVPREYRNALKSAESYSEWMHMSKQGIYDQLTSEYGDQFPEDAAQYAIDHLDADYKQNALESAKSYSEWASMSDQALYEQLTSQYGDKFTAEEAQYAIDHLDD